MDINLHAPFRLMRAATDALIASGGLPKGDALATARVAGILAAKRTSDLIPLCHPLALTGVDVDFEVGEGNIAITATVRNTDRTGGWREAVSLPPRSRETHPLGRPVNRRDCGRDLLPRVRRREVLDGRDHPVDQAAPDLRG
jgi:hypothetical protein